MLVLGVCAIHFITEYEASDKAISGTVEARFAEPIMKL